MTDQRTVGPYTIHGLTLANGLRAAVIPTSQPTVTVGMMMAVGSTNETQGVSGFAHLFEHLMFEGTEAVPKGQYDALLYQVGADNNAWTDKEFTFYHSHGPAGNLDTMLWLEADRLANLAITQVALANQQAVVIEEMKQVIDNEPYGRLDISCDELAFDNWHYGHPVIGDERDIRDSNLATVQRFHAEHYQPKNAIVGIMGHVTPDMGLEQIESLFGSIPGGNSRFVPPRAAETWTGIRTKRIEDPLAPTPGLVMTWPLPPASQIQEAALTALTQWLGHGDSSVLERKLVRETQTLLEIEAYSDVSMGPSSFTLEMRYAPEHEPAQIVAQVLDVLGDAIQAGPDPVSFERVMNKIEVQNAEYWLHPTHILAGLMSDLWVHGDVAYHNRFMADLHALSPADIASLAAQILKPDRLAWVEARAPRA